MWCIMIVSIIEIEVKDNETMVTVSRTVVDCADYDYPAIVTIVIGVIGS